MKTTTGTMKKLGVLLLGTSMLAIALGQHAEARSVPAAAGGPFFVSEQSCWVRGSETMQNTCTGQRSFHIPLVVDSIGTKNTVVTAYGATPVNNVGCQAIGISRDALSAWTSGSYRYLPIFGSAQDISLSVYVPSGGSLYVDCLASQNGRIHKVDYTP
jgi:hypothetical protein